MNEQDEMVQMDFRIRQTKIMKQRIAHIALVVDDYDKAIEFYTRKLHFTLLEDTILSDTKRWVLVAPKGSSECCLLLAKAANEEQSTRVGNQTGGRVFLFLYTDNFRRDYQNLQDHGITIVREPVTETWGTVAVFEDLYGNLWDLIEPALDRMRP
jgi:catechol 2,3-dioxygenase-like lactoylglutathione lyase family enzyme